MFVQTHTLPASNIRLRILGTKFLIFSLLLIWCIGFFSPVFQSSLSLVSYPLLNSIYSKFCHQDPSKSFYINENKLLVCARCTGIYLGALSVLFLSLIINFRIKTASEFKLLLFSGLPMLIDVLLYNTGVYNYSKIIALATGLILGAAAAVCINNFIVHSIEKRIPYE
jgi:uncharacterized membrane protein